MGPSSQRQRRVYCSTTGRHRRLRATGSRRCCWARRSGAGPHVDRPRPSGFRCGLRMPRTERHLTGVQHQSPGEEACIRDWSHPAPGSRCAGQVVRRDAAQVIVVHRNKASSMAVSGPYCRMKSAHAIGSNVSRSGSADIAPQRWIASPGSPFNCFWVYFADASGIAEE